MLSMENGHISLIPTSAQSTHRMDFGALFKTALSSTTAKISHPAVMLMFRSLIKIVSMLIPPHARLSCGVFGQSGPLRDFYAW